MARQRGIIKLSGTIADITFYKSGDGYMAKEKSVISAERYATDPAFDRTRENAAEFGRATSAAKALRKSLRPLLQHARDRRMVGRLNQVMVRVVKSDSVSERGQRTIINGDLSLLQGFEFNQNGQLDNTLFSLYESTFDRATGEAELSLEAFVPAQMITAPEGTTHFQISAGAAEVDFESGLFVLDTAESAQMPWDNTSVAAQTLTCLLPAASILPVFMVLGVAFFQQVNGKFYPLKNGAHNALRMVMVEV